LATALGNNQTAARVDWQLTAGPVIFSPGSTNGPTGALDATAFGYPPISALGQQHFPTESVAVSLFSIYPQPAPSQSGTQN